MFRRIAWIAVLLALGSASVSALDEDGDQLSDLFEQINGGDLQPDDDLDEDGYTNLEEYLLGGDPNVADLFGFFSFDKETNTVSWPTQVGLRYRVETATELEDWLSIEEEIDFVGDGTPQEVVLLDAGTGEPSRLFVRVVGLEPIDQDADLLNSWEEAQFGSDPLQADADGDKLTDAQEFTRSLDPNDGSSGDGDPLPDDWEIFYFGDTATSDGSLDDDSDGLTTLDEFLASAPISPVDFDSDDDGRRDGDDGNPDDPEDGVPLLGFFDRPAYVINANLFGQHLFFATNNRCLTTDDNFTIGFSQFLPRPIALFCGGQTVYNDSFFSFRRAGTSDVITAETNDGTPMSAGITWNGTPSDPREFNAIVNVPNDTPQWYVTNEGGFFAEENAVGTTDEQFFALLQDSNVGTNEPNMGTVYWVHFDLDIDSNNDNGSKNPDRSTEEDSIEDSDPGETGAKFVLPNIDDDDGDGTIDNVDFSNAMENDLVPMVLDIAPSDLPYNFLYVLFRVQKPDETPDTGVRIWKAQEQTADRQSSDELALETIMPVSDLGVTSENPEVKFYVESTDDVVSLDTRIIAELYFKTTGTPTVGDMPFAEDVVKINRHPIEIIVHERDQLCNQAPSLKEPAYFAISRALNQFGEARRQSVEDLLYNQLFVSVEPESGQVLIRDTNSSLLISML